MIWPSPEVRRAAVELEPPEQVLECDRRQVGHDIAPHILQDTQIAIAQEDGSQPVLRAINELVVALLDHELRRSRPDVLLDLIKLHERTCAHEERLVAALPARAELPESSEVFFGNSETNPYANIALRGLIERVAASPPTGQLVSSRAQLLRLRALSESLVEWGTAFDALHAGLATARVAIGAPLGCRVVTDGPIIKAQHAVMSRLAQSASALTMVAQRDRWSDAPREASESRLDEPLKFEDSTWRSVDVEMARVWGFSLDAMLRTLRALSDHAEQEGDKTAIEEINSARALVHVATGIPTPQVDLILANLTLTRQAEYDPLEREFKPWRANRERSYLRRPLVELADGRLAWGALHTLQTIRYVVHLIETGRLPCSGRLRRAIRACSQHLDRDFEREVERACKKLGWETRSNVRKLDKVRIERDRGEDLGDLDVLAWDRASARVWALDAKRISPSIVPIDMRRETRTLEEKIEKHLNRLRWLNTHPEPVDRRDRPTRQRRPLEGAGGVGEPTAPGWRTPELPATSRLVAERDGPASPSLTSGQPPSTRFAAEAARGLSAVPNQGASSPISRHPACTGARLPIPIEGRARARRSERPAESCAAPVACPTRHSP